VSSAVMSRCTSMARVCLVNSFGAFAAPTTAPVGQDPAEGCRIGAGATLYHGYVVLTDGRGS
jgi:hypothetical protein